MIGNLYDAKFLESRTDSDRWYEIRPENHLSPRFRIWERFSDDILVRSWRSQTNGDLKLHSLAISSFSLEISIAPDDLMFVVAISASLGDLSGDLGDLSGVTGDVSMEFEQLLSFQIMNETKQQKYVGNSY